MSKAITDISIFDEIISSLTQAGRLSSQVEYDGLIVKKIAGSNSSGKEETSSGQTHIAITGVQMDLFPNLYASSYEDKTLEVDNRLPFKGFFTLRIPYHISKINSDLINTGIEFDGNSDLITYGSVVKSYRESSDSHQIELSVKTLDDEDFKCFINHLSANDLLVILKRKKCFEYELLGIRTTDQLYEEFLNYESNLYIRFETPVKTKTPVEVDLFENSLNKPDKEINHSFNRIVFGAPGTGKSYKLNQNAQIFTTQDIAFVRDSLLETKIKDELKDWKRRDPDSMPQYAYEVKIGSKYSYYLCGLLNSGVGGQEFKSLFEITNTSDYMKYGALANRTEHCSKFLERVTFHPNYSYAQFVGTHKPIQDRENKENIQYEYIPGPFMRIYVNAKRNPEKNFLLLIEEINRANVAAVFGDIFQLLDRQSDGTSQYPIAASEDQKNYLESCGINEDEISIPSNMYIWATMNSADQGVLPMDAAFKRRWDFEYLGIDDNEDSIKDYVLPIPQKDSDGKISYTSLNWNKIRHAINDKLKNIYGVNEDKLLGPYFLSKSTLDEAKHINCETETDKAEKICSLFKSKVLMYLYEDVVKMNPTELFNKSVFSEDKPLHYSDLCNIFDELGLKIFDEDFIK